MQRSFARGPCDAAIRSYARILRHRCSTRGLGLLWLALATAAPIGVGFAQDCAALDADGNGVITAVDVTPVALEFALIRSCLGTVLDRALDCRGRDLDRNQRVDTADVRLFDALALEPLAACWSADVSVRSACAGFDLDGDGSVAQGDVEPLIAFRERVGECVGVDLAPLACEPVDHDGDGSITTVDLTPVLARFEAFEACLDALVRAPVPAAGLWIDRDRLRGLPTSGAAWERLWREATGPTPPPDLADPQDRADTHAWAQALVGVRLGDESMLASVRATLERLVRERSENGADALAVARNVVGFVLAADLIELSRVDPALDSAFRTRLATLRDRDLQGRTLRSTHDERPNNWGTHAGAARIAIALYLGDDEDLAAAAAVHRAWLGERGASPPAFRFGARSWQADPARPVGVNPRGARIAGIDVDGALPEEMRRGGALDDPPAHTGYAWEALQGATVATELLSRNGYPEAWRWGDDALERAVAYLYRLDARFGGWAATGDDRWNVWLINRRTGRSDPVEAGVSVGKNMGFTDWTHAD